jgi:hypothetical protein
LFALFSLFSDLAMSISSYVASHFVLQDSQTYSNFWLPYITTAQVAGSTVQLTTATALSLAQNGKLLYWLEGLPAVLLLGDLSWYIYRLKAT